MNFIWTNRKEGEFKIVGNGTVRKGSIVSGSTTGDFKVNSNGVDNYYREDNKGRIFCYDKHYTRSLEPYTVWSQKYLELMISELKKSEQKGLSRAGSRETSPARVGMRPTTAAPPATISLRPPLPPSPVAAVRVLAGAGSGAVAESSFLSNVRRLCSGEYEYLYLKRSDLELWCKAVKVDKEGMECSESLSNGMIRKFSCNESGEWVENYYKDGKLVEWSDGRSEFSKFYQIDVHTISPRQSQMSYCCLVDSESGKVSNFVSLSHSALEIIKEFHGLATSERVDPEAGVFSPLQIADLEPYHAKERHKKVFAELEKVKNHGGLLMINPKDSDSSYGIQFIPEEREEGLLEFDLMKKDRGALVSCERFFISKEIIGVYRDVVESYVDALDLFCDLERNVVDLVDSEITEKKEDFIEDEYDFFVEWLRICKQYHFVSFRLRDCGKMSLFKVGKSDLKDGNLNFYIHVYRSSEISPDESVFCSIDEEGLRITKSRGGELFPLDNYLLFRVLNSFYNNLHVSHKIINFNIDSCEIAIRQQSLDKKTVTAGLCFGEDIEGSVREHGLYLLQIWSYIKQSETPLDRDKVIKIIESIYDLDSSLYKCSAMNRVGCSNDYIKTVLINILIAATGERIEKDLILEIIGRAQGKSDNDRKFAHIFVFIDSLIDSGKYGLEYDFNITEIPTLIDFKVRSESFLKTLIGLRSLSSVSPAFASDVDDSVVAVRGFLESLEVGSEASSRASDFEETEELARNLQEILLILNDEELISSEVFRKEEGEDCTIFSITKEDGGIIVRIIKENEKLFLFLGDKKVIIDLNLSKKLLSALGIRATENVDVLPEPNSSALSSSFSLERTRETVFFETPQGGTPGEEGEDFGDASGAGMLDLSRTDDTDDSDVREISQRELLVKNIIEEVRGIFPSDCEMHLMGLGGDRKIIAKLKNRIFSVSVSIEEDEYQQNADDQVIRLRNAEDNSVFDALSRIDLRLRRISLTNLSKSEIDNEQLGLLLVFLEKFNLEKIKSNEILQIRGGGMRGIAVTTIRALASSPGRTALEHVSPGGGVAGAGGPFLVGSVPFPALEAQALLQTGPAAPVLNTSHQPSVSHYSSSMGDVVSLARDPEVPNVEDFDIPFGGHVAASPKFRDAAATLLERFISRSLSDIKTKFSNIILNVEKQSFFKSKGYTFDKDVSKFSFFYKFDESETVTYCKINLPKDSGISLENIARIYDFISELESRFESSQKIIGSLSKLGLSLEGFCDPDSTEDDPIRYSKNDHIIMRNGIEMKASDLVALISKVEKYKEERARQEAEAKLRQEAEAKLRQEAEAKLRQEADRMREDTEYCFNILSDILKKGRGRDFLIDNGIEISDLENKKFALQNEEGKLIFSFANGSIVSGSGYNSTDPKKVFDTIKRHFSAYKIQSFVRTQEKRKEEMGLKRKFFESLKKDTREKAEQEERASKRADKKLIGSAFAHWRSKIEQKRESREQDIKAQGFRDAKLKKKMFSGFASHSQEQKNIREVLMQSVVHSIYNAALCIENGEIDKSHSLRVLKILRGLSVEEMPYTDTDIRGLDFDDMMTKDDDGKKAILNQRGVMATHIHIQEDGKKVIDFEKTLSLNISLIANLRKFNKKLEGEKSLEEVVFKVFNLIAKTPITDDDLTKEVMQDLKAIGVVVEGFNDGKVTHVGRDSKDSVINRLLKIRETFMGCFAEFCKDIPGLDLVKSDSGEDVNPITNADLRKRLLGVIEDRPTPSPLTSGAHRGASRLDGRGGAGAGAAAGSS
jgi:hypothetical protein